MFKTIREDKIRTSTARWPCPNRETSVHRRRYGRAPARRTHGIQMKKNNGDESIRDVSMLGPHDETKEEVEEERMAVSICGFYPLAFPGKM